MANERKESLLEQAKHKLKDLAGLPPGRFPDGEPVPSDGHRPPPGGLTAEDAEGLPPHGGSGIAKAE